MEGGGQRPLIRSEPGCGCDDQSPAARSWPVPERAWSGETAEKRLSNGMSSPLCARGGGSGGGCMGKRECPPGHHKAPQVGKRLRNESYPPPHHNSHRPHEDEGRVSCTWVREGQLDRGQAGGGEAGGGKVAGSSCPSGLIGPQGKGVVKVRKALV